MKFWLRTHLALIGYVILALGIVLGFFLLNQSRVALCGLRNNLDSQIESSQGLLKEHPRGPIFGIPRNVIETNLATMKRTRKTLHVVWCRKD